MLSTFLNLIFGIVFVYFALSVLYLFILSLSGKLFFKKNKFLPTSPSKKIAVFVPAYKEDGIIVSTANSMLKLDYPRELYDVYILADSFQEETLIELRKLPIEVIEVKFEKSTKAKALNVGFNKIKTEYDIALICDADNVLARNFLKKVNDAFNGGARAIQGQRVAKNMDTSYAILDSCSEGINNHIFRKGTNAVGLSSAVIGSGMAFEYDTVRKVLSEIHAVGGFDRPLQIKIVEQRIKIEYLEDALVFDEKVDSLHAFQQQRKRWLSSQFVYMKQFFFPGIKQLFKGNVSYFNLAIANNLVLPRAYLILALPVLIVVTFFLHTGWFLYFLITGILYFITLAIALPPVLVNKKLFNAILKMPEAVIAMIMTAFQMKNANKTFIHTVHTKTEVSNTLYNQGTE
ncbi:MAG TPA: glycosyltransferase family 2 protein [Flavisolibacter sp.]|nr:glycosyltransferase family 2 protein [Flavisolibacter sp.]